MPVRRVRRVIRKIDPWTVLKVSLVFNAILGLAVVLGSIVFWSIFVNAGIPDKISELAERLTLSFEPQGETYFRIVVLLSVMWTVVATGLATVGAVLYNLISDVVGGIEVVVLEETLAPASQVTAPRQRRLRRPVTAPTTTPARPAGAPTVVRPPATPAPQRPAAAAAAQQAPPAPKPAAAAAAQEAPTAPNGRTDATGDVPVKPAPVVKVRETKAG